METGNTAALSLDDSQIHEREKDCNGRTMFVETLPLTFLKTNSKEAENVKMEYSSPKPVSPAAKACSEAENIRQSQKTSIVTNYLIITMKIGKGLRADPKKSTRSF